MVVKQNCWEFKQCGREPGGKKVKDLGVCPVVNDSICNTMNGGKNAGRICWAVAGTFCGSKIRGTFVQKQVSCMICDFFKKVKEEEIAGTFKFLQPGQNYKPAYK